MFSVRNLKLMERICSYGYLTAVYAFVKRCINHQIYSERKKFIAKMKVIMPWVGERLIRNEQPVIFLPQAIYVWIKQ
jgi:hypothetical protein